MDTGAVHALSVGYEVPLPLVPAGLRGWVPLAVTVAAAHVAPVEERVAVRP